MKKKALILGGFGSVGFACADELARAGFDIVIVHRGRRSKAMDAESKIKHLENCGASVLAIKGNAASEECIDKVCELLQDQKINCFVHAIADGNIGTIFGDRRLNAESFVYTFNSMCISFALWAQKLVSCNLMEKNSHLIGFSSNGSAKTYPQYAANGVAKAGLETLALYMAEELNRYNISVNIIRAGIMDTNAIRAFDCYDNLMEIAAMENRNHKPVEPDAVARKVVEVISSGKIASGTIVEAEE